MPLSWNEIRARSARFAEEWKNAHYEKGETQSFYNDFFEVFGRRRKDVAVYEKKVKKPRHGLKKINTHIYIEILKLKILVN